MGHICPGCRNYYEGCTEARATELQGQTVEVCVDDSPIENGIGRALKAAATAGNCAD